MADRLDRDLLLWRGAEFAEGDVDLVVMPNAVAELEAMLRAAGVQPLACGPHRTVWSAPGVEIDVLHAAGWPKAYPPLTHVISRAERPAGLPPLASGGDRLLVFAADLLAGRSVEKMLHKAQPLLAQPGASDDLARLAASERMEPVASLVADPDRTRRIARRDRVPYGRAAAVAMRSKAARAALTGRMAVRARALVPRRRGVLVTVSGMDGAGKSTAAAVAREQLELHGLRADVRWNRFVDADTRTLDQISSPIKRLLRRRTGFADPVAVRGDAAAAERPSRTRTPVWWAWVLVVAAVNVRSSRRVAHRRGRIGVVCDRWAADSLVDLEIRYGRHKLAAAFIRRALPDPDLALFLSVDARTAASRKPGDQSLAVLELMEPLYEARARELGLLQIDGRGARDDVERVTAHAIERLIAELER